MQRLQRQLRFVYLRRRIRGQFQLIYRKRGLLHVEFRQGSSRDENWDIPWTSKVFPDFAFTHSPLTYATFVFNKDGSLSFGTLCDMVEAGLIYRDGKLKGWNRDRASVREVEAVVLKMGFMLKPGPNRGRTPLLGAQYRHRGNDIENGGKESAIGCGKRGKARRPTTRRSYKSMPSMPSEKWGEV